MRSSVTDHCFKEKLKNIHLLIGTYLHAQFTRLKMILGVTKQVGEALQREQRQGRVVSIGIAPWGILENSQQLITRGGGVDYEVLPDPEYVKFVVISHSCYLGYFNVNCFQVQIYSIKQPTRLFSIGG